MELAEVRDGLASYVARMREVKASEVQNKELALEFLRQVLGYSLPEEVVVLSVLPSKGEYRPPDPTVKFLLRSSASVDVDGDMQVQQAAELAAKVGAMLFMLTDGRRVKVCGVEIEGARLEVEPMFELDLLADDLDEAAAILWTISRKDCGKRVLVASD